MDSHLVAQLRSDLREAGFSLPALAALWGNTAELARQRGVFLPAQRVLAERAPSALSTIARVFALGEGVPAAELDRALPRLGSAGALRLGLVTGDKAGASADSAPLRAALSLTAVELPPQPVVAATTRTGNEDTADTAETAGMAGAHPGGVVSSWWILSDLDDALRQGPARPDHVMGVGGATRTLIAQIPPHAAARALDLGTGCGIVALYLAESGAGQVTATDISERALMLAAANAELNGYGGAIEFVLGSLFEPVTGREFDLMVSNPPFVITPRSEDEGERYDYRDGGMTGDELAATVVRGAPAHLAAGGQLVCLANWETEWGGHGLERVAGWVREAAIAHDTALDAWIVERDRVDTVQYAETWARDGGARPGQAAFDELLAEWLHDFGARRIVSVGLGAIHLRRATIAAPGNAADASVIHAEQATGQLAASGLGAAMAGAFAAGVGAARASDTEVLGTRWVRSPLVSEERTHVPGEESPSAIALTIAAPIGRRVAADTLLAAAVGVCDGELTLGQIADALATILEVDAAAAAEALAAGVRELSWLGMLSPKPAGR